MSLSWIFELILPPLLNVEFVTISRLHYIRLSNRSSSSAVLVPVSAPAAPEVDVGALSLVVLKIWVEIIFLSTSNGELPKPWNGEELEGGGGGLIDGGLCNFGARKGIAGSSSSFWTDTAGADSGEFDVLGGFGTPEEEDFPWDKICSFWYSANSFLIASTRADTASAAAEPESPLPLAGVGRPLGNTGEYISLSLKTLWSLRASSAAEPSSRSTLGL